MDGHIRALMYMVQIGKPSIWSVFLGRVSPRLDEAVEQTQQNVMQLGTC